MMMMMMMMKNTKENSISISISVIFCAFPEKKTTKKLEKTKLTSFQFFIVTKIIEFDEVVFFYFYFFV